MVRQLDRLKESQKYIPATFVEVGTNKETLRYFCDPTGFLPKVMWEYSILDFMPLNQLLTKKSAGTFDFELSGLETEAQNIDLATIHEFSIRLDQYLKEKVAELEKLKVASSSVRNFSYKISRLAETSSWLGKKVCLIKESAGQGKTNFICDLVDNFFMKRQIPAVFLLGTDIDPSDIRKSIMKRIYPDRSVLDFENFLSEVRAHCQEVDRPFVIIIDGLNENGAPRELSKKLELFISEIIEHPFLKVLVSCRSEYYKKHFSNLDKSAFSSVMAETGHLRVFRENVAADKIFSAYMQYFDIDLKTYSTRVFEQLTQNFLLLRIFCDAHRGEMIPYLGHIQKETLFRRYFETKIDEITKRMEGDDEFYVGGIFNIKNFIARLITYMVEHRKYENIPLDDLLEKKANQKVYIRFLDENILVRRDPTGSGGIFGDQEVVNFTFDEFRDYLIADYLISKLYRSNEAQFIRFLEEEIDPSSRILEGCGTFLYYIAKKSGDSKLLAVVERQSWFETVFLRCVFNLEDRYVEACDRDRIFAASKTDLDKAETIFWRFLYRHKSGDSPNLNLQHYLEHLRTLSEDEFSRDFLKLFHNEKYSHHLVNIDTFLPLFEKRLGITANDEDPDAGDEDDDDGIDLQEDFPHAFFEVLVYLFSHRLSWEVSTVYERYYHKYPVQAKDQMREARKSENKLILKGIQSFCHRYDISL